MKFTIYSIFSLVLVLWNILLSSQAQPLFGLRHKQNFFGVNHNHKSFGATKYDKNCFFSPVNCILYKGPYDERSKKRIAVFLRRAKDQ